MRKLQSWHQQCSSITINPQDLSKTLTAPHAPTRGAPWLLTRDFRLVWWSQLLSQVADGVSKLALLWFVYSVTGSPLKTTIIGVLQNVPPIVFSPLIGVFVDRFPKKAILIATDVARAILIGVIPCMISVERFTVESLYLLVFLYGVATAMFVPTLSSSVPFMVSRRQFTAANALLQSTTSIGIIMGPALSGLGIAMAGSQEVLCLNAATYLASAACLLPINLISALTSASKASRPDNPFKALMRDLVEGMRYVFGHHSILLIILMASLYTFAAGAFTTLFPVFGKKLLDLGPVEIGFLWSWLGVGLLLVSMLLVRLTTWEMRGRIQAISLSGIIGGAALCGLVWTHGLLWATLLVAIIGMGLGMWTPIAWGLIQEISPAHMVGRVMAIYTAIATAASMVGMTAFGWIIEAYNEQTGLIGIGLVLFIMAVVAIWFSARIDTAHDSTLRSV
ncbi:MAG TPA: MFS transporter [Nitrospiraceae bacterium]|nr:MFS transporter [Nitrospiraceae bacterium]